MKLRDRAKPQRLIDHVKKFSTSAEVHDHIEIMCCFLTRMDETTTTKWWTTAELNNNNNKDDAHEPTQKKNKVFPSWFYCLVGRDSAIPTMGNNDPCDQRWYSLVDDRKKGIFSTAPMKKALWNYGCTRMRKPNVPLFFTEGKEGSLQWDWLRAISSANLQQIHRTIIQVWQRNTAESHKRPIHGQCSLEGRIAAPKSSSALRSPLLFPSRWPIMDPDPRCFSPKGRMFQGSQQIHFPSKHAQRIRPQTTRQKKKNVVKRTECLPPAFWGRIFWMALKKALKNAIRKEYSWRSIQWPLLHPNLYRKPWFKADFLAGSHQLPHNFPPGCFCQAASFGPFRCHRSPAFRHL